MGRRYKMFREDVRNWYEGMTALPGVALMLFGEVVGKIREDYNDRNS